MDRRTLLRGGLAGLGGVAASSLVGACAPTDPLPPGPWDCGVASGVHSDTAVVLWTRFAPAAVGPSVELAWTVAADPELTRVVASGVGSAAASSDGCCKVLAEGLEPGSTYWYRFEVDGLTSPTGRTRTLPAATGSPRRVRLAVASCQQYTAGYFPAWRAIAEEPDIDAVVHLGDYIYESGGWSPFDVRSDGVGTAEDLAGYRAKYRVYRGDPDLRAAHAAHPFATVWDDHELVNDYHRLTLVEDAARARAAYRAWWEYQPVWPIEGDRIHRSVRFGDLLELALLDTRQYRDPQPMTPDGARPVFGATLDHPNRVVHDEDRTILGPDQRRWLFDRLGAAEQDGVTWKLLGNQVMISPIRIIDLDEPYVRSMVDDLPRHAGVYINFDDWDGYQVERDLLLDHIAQEGVANVGVLTGDIHSFWQSGVRQDFDDARSPVVLQEFVCGSISSRGADFTGDLAPELARAVRTARPGFRFVDLTRRGYGLVELTPEHARVEFQRVDALSRRSEPRLLARFDWPAGTQQVTVSRS